MTLLLPQSSWPGLDGAGQGAELTHHAVRAASLVHYTTVAAGKPRGRKILQVGRGDQ